MSLFVAGTVCAQSAPDGESAPPDIAGIPPGSADMPPIIASTVSVNAPKLYAPPTQEQKFQSFVWNALGPGAIAGASVAGAIDQGFYFPRRWGQGADAYAERVASNLGIGLVSASAQYSLGEAFHQDTAYHRCTCSGFFPRFFHAAVSTFAARRESDGRPEFSVALTASPFIGPVVAANTWMPTSNGVRLGLRMGAHNLIGQFGQNETLEFLHIAPHSILNRIQHHLFGL